MRVASVGPTDFGAAAGFGLAGGFLTSGVVGEGGACAKTTCVAERLHTSANDSASERVDKRGERLNAIANFKHLQAKWVERSLSFGRCATQFQCRLQAMLGFCRLGSVNRLATQGVAK